MASLPSAFIILSTTLSASYKLSRQCCLSRIARRRLTAAHAFAIETVQLCLLILAIFNCISMATSGEKSRTLLGFGIVISNLVPVVGTIIFYLIAILAIDAIDNKIQLGSCRNPVQTQAFLLTRSKLLPQTVRWPKKSMAFELDARPPWSVAVEKDPTESRLYKTKKSLKPMHIVSGSGLVARLVSAFEQNIRTPQKNDGPIAGINVPSFIQNEDSIKHDAEGILCPSGCGEHFSTQEEVQQHILEHHGPWVCQICNPPGNFTGKRVSSRCESLTRHLRLVHGMFWKPSDGHSPPQRTTVLPRPDPPRIMNPFGSQQATSSFTSIDERKPTEGQSSTPKTLLSNSDNGSEDMASSPFVVNITPLTPSPSSRALRLAQDPQSSHPHEARHTAERLKRRNTQSTTDSEMKTPAPERSETSGKTREQSRLDNGKYEEGRDIRYVVAEKIHTL